MIPSEVYAAFSLHPDEYSVELLKGGLINKTYHLKSKNEGGKDYVIQRINTTVFKNPASISKNLSVASEYLKRYQPAYLFLHPVKTTSGDLLHWHVNQCWRALPYITDAVTLPEATDEKQVYQAAKQFGKLCKLLTAIPISKFENVIPDFHDLSKRYEQFSTSLKSGAIGKIEMASDAINQVFKYKSILKCYVEMMRDENLPLRVIHHDTKLSNVLLDEKSFEGLCVIDLDTMMPGYVSSDLGDMMRTYLCPYSEEESDLTKLHIRLNYFEAIVNGWLSEMRSYITEAEKKYVPYSGEFMVYLQGIRFLTDYLNNDIYYPTNHPEHNLLRAKNQFRLLELLVENRDELKRITENCLNMQCDEQFSNSITLKC